MTHTYLSKVLPPPPESSSITHPHSMCSQNLISEKSTFDNFKHNANIISYKNIY